MVYYTHMDIDLIHWIGIGLHELMTMPEPVQRESVNPMRRENSMEDVITGTGNVYSDLGNPDAKSMLVKAHLATAIADSIEARKLTQSQAAEILGLAQPKLSNLLNGRFRGISEAKMMDCLTRLGRDIRIVIGMERPRRKKPGKIQVMQEA